MLWYDEAKERRARGYWRIQSRLFVLRLLLMVGLAALFWGTGLSANLAAGLRARLTFSMAWPLISFLFVALSVFAYETLLFPLSVFDDYSLEKWYDASDVEFGEWLRLYLVTLLIEMVLVGAAFTGLFLFLRLTPAFAWAVATSVYMVLVIGLGEWGQTDLLPFIRPPKESADDEANQSLMELGESLGVRVDKVMWWDFEHQEQLRAASLTRRGKRRQLIFSEWAWNELTLEERHFVAAREMARVRSRCGWRVHGAQLLLAANVFFWSARAADSAARRWGAAGGAQAIESFPLLVIALFIGAALSAVAVHALSRRAELRADRAALRAAGGRAVLQSILAKEFAREPFGVDAEPWMIWLLQREPTAAQRLAQARRLEAAAGGGAAAGASN